jgi:hypothetical protein
MRKITEVRRDNLRALVAREGGGAKVASRLGYRSASFLSQQIGPKPSREITEKTAREYEAKLGLPEGALDRQEGPPQPGAQAIDTSVLVDVIRLLGGVLEAEKVNLPAGRFADVAALAVEDAVTHGGKPRESHIKSLVRLVK